MAQQAATSTVIEVQVGAEKPNHCLSWVKRCHETPAVTSPNADRFYKFFHYAIRP